MVKCIKCGDTGIKANGERCDCQAGNDGLELPVILDIPEQYQACYFDVSFLPKKLHDSYGSVLQGIISEIKVSKAYSKNVLICAPPNSGKSVFAYTIYRIFAQNNLPFSDIYDLNEVKKLMSDIWDVDGKFKLLIGASLAIIKIPLDLPAKFAETICTVLDLRIRHGGKTIFLYDGSKDDLLAQDKYGRIEDILGDGSYHTVACYSYTKEREISKENENETN